MAEGNLNAFDGTPIALPSVRPAAVHREQAVAASAVLPCGLLDQPGIGAVMVVSARQYLSPLGEVVHAAKRVMSDAARQAM
jgi:hypothetical protein